MPSCLRAVLRVAALSCALIATASAEEARVAVAANFLETLRSLAEEFERTSDHRVEVTPGSTGLLVAQIRNGAPFDVLLAADDVRPAALVRDGFSANVNVSDDSPVVFTYAVGRLALWSATPGRIDESTLDDLSGESFRWLAIAESRTAPYGAAAREVLEQLGVWQALQSRIVRGHNVAQTFAMIQTGNAELGFVALSQALAWEGGSSWTTVPDSLHEPIAQDAVLLKRGETNPAARAFFSWLRSATAGQLIESRGYSVPDSP